MSILIIIKKILLISLKLFIVLRLMVEHWLMYPLSLVDTVLLPFNLKQNVHVAMCVAVFHAVCSIFSNVSRSSRVTPFIWTVCAQCLYCRATAMLVYVSLLLSGMTCSLMRPGRVWNWHRPQETRPPSAVPGTG